MMPANPRSEFDSPPRSDDILSAGNFAMSNVGLTERNFEAILKVPSFPSRPWGDGDEAYLVCLCNLSCRRHRRRGTGVFRV